MSDDKYTLRDVANVVENEGLGYAIYGYLSHTNIADPKLAELWKQAGTLIEEIEGMLPDPEEEDEI